MTASPTDPSMSPEFLMAMGRVRMPMPMLPLRMWIMVSKFLEHIKHIRTKLWIHDSVKLRDYKPFASLGTGVIFIVLRDQVLLRAGVIFMKDIPTKNSRRRGSSEEAWYLRLNLGCCLTCGWDCSPIETFQGIQNLNINLRIWIINKMVTKTTYNTRKILLT